MVKVLAAGSLRYAFALMSAEYKSLYGDMPEIDFGPAGILCDRIIHGEKIDLFASANTAHPQKLLQMGLAQKVIPFAHNSLCITIRNSPETANLDWFAALTDPNLVIGMSTPVCDPSGDYTLELFNNIEKTNAGIGNAIKERARSLVGGKTNNVPPNESPAQWFIKNGMADMFIGYKSNAVNLVSPELRALEIPASHNVRADYAMALMTDKAEQFAGFICGAGKKYLQKAGYEV
jgi:molybdate transport system substrate-binding protein